MSFHDDLEELGFRLAGESRRGGRMWALRFNRHLRFTLHDHGDRIVMTWSFALGEHLEERGWQVSLADSSAVELYPIHDVVVPADMESVRGEITRVLSSLRLDLGDPAL